MALKCIPRNPKWCDDTNQDFVAIYTRRMQDNWGTPILDEQGREQWNTTGPLPMRRHSDWENKGFHYLTLYMTNDDHRWPMVANWIRQQTGDDPNTYIQNRRERSTFDAGLWMQDAAKERAAEIDVLRQQIAKFGAEAVVEIRRQTNPGFRLPSELLTVSDVTDQPEVAAAWARLDEVVAQRAEAPKRKPGRPRKTEAVA